MPARGRGRGRRRVQEPHDENQEQDPEERSHDGGPGVLGPLVDDHPDLPSRGRFAELGTG